MRTENIKDKVLSLLNGMRSDSKTESYKCEKELVKIINRIHEKLTLIQIDVGYYEDDYPIIDEITHHGYCDKLPETILCYYNNYLECEFETKYFDYDESDYKKYFEHLKTKQINYFERVIERYENELEKYREKLEGIKNLNYGETR